MSKLSSRHVLLGLSAGLALGWAPAAYAQDQNITLAVVSEPSDMDVCRLSENPIGVIAKNNIYETVTEIDPATGELRPRLAESWERIDDLTWRFKIRQGVTFHDGTPMDATAFADSFKRTLDPALDCTTRLLYFAGFETEVNVVDPTTVEVKTSIPVPLLPTLMSYLGVGKAPADPSQLSREPVGTGPYKFVSWTPGTSIVVGKYDGYWGETGPVTGATYVFRLETAVRAAMVATGEAYIGYRISVIDADNPATDFTYLNSETERLRFDIYKPPLDDVRVRQAINYAIDREGLIGTVYPDTYQIAANFVMSTINGYNANVQPYPYDPEKAKALIEEARADGVPVDSEIEYHIQNYGGTNLELPTVLTEMMNGVGLNVKMILAGDNLGYYKPFPEGQPANIYNDIHDNNSGDAGITLIGKYTSEGGSSKVADPELDALVQKGLAADNPERKQSRARRPTPRSSSATSPSTEGADMRGAAHRLRRLRT